MTHGIIRTAAGGTGAGDRTAIGALITLPAGGPFIIHGLWGQVAKRTAVPNEGSGGILELVSVQGDLEPNPAPANFPMIGACTSESANAAISAQPLQVWPVRYTAPGKAQLRLYYTNDQAITTGSRVLAGILFGNEIPVPTPAPFCASILNQWAATAEANFGTITLSEGATRIVGILADCNKADAPTAAEEIAATVRLSSDSVVFQPGEFPCNRAFNSSDGTAVGNATTPMSNIIPLDIPVVGGAIITVYGTSTISVTGNISVRVSIFYE